MKKKIFYIAWGIITVLAVGFFLYVTAISFVNNLSTRAVQVGYQQAGNEILRQLDTNNEVQLQRPVVGGLNGELETITLVVQPK